MMTEIKYHPVPQPDEIPIREREDAMGSYLMMFAAMGVGLPLPIINLIAAVIYYYINKSKSKFVDFHITQSLYSQFPTTLLNAGAVFWGIRIALFNWQWTDYFNAYLILIAVANLLYFIFSIVGAIRARQGRFYYFLFFGKLAYHQAYKIKEESKTKTINQAPIQ